MPLERLVLISAYRMPTHHALMLGEDDTSAWLLAWRTLWHPELLKLSVELPAMAEPTQHAQPEARTLYALPVSPDPYLPDDWDEQLATVGSAAFRTAPTWEETQANLHAALARMNVDPSAWDSGAAAGPFYAIGFGHAVVDTLFEAMYHDKLLDVPAFTAELKAAAAGTGSIQAAVDRLAAARDTLYPVVIHLIELGFLGQMPIEDILNRRQPLSLIATAGELAKLTDEERAAITARVAQGVIEVCGGIDYDRPEAFLPLESQLWNLRRGQSRFQEMVGQPATVYARATTAFHPYIPNWLAQGNLTKLMYVPFDGAAIPHHAAAAIRWPAPDGRQADAFTRVPWSGADPQVYFHLAHYLHQSIANDSTAVLALRQSDRNPGPWYDDWMTLSQLAPVLGTWTTVGRFLDNAQVGEYARATTCDDYPPEDLESAVSSGAADPVSRYARHARLRRRVDAAFVYEALHHSLGDPGSELPNVNAIEDEVERGFGHEPGALADVERAAAVRLARRLVRRTKNGGPGWLILNPSAMTRRVGIETGDWPGAPVVAGPVKASQRDGEVTRSVVEVPGLGFAWIPAQWAEPAAGRLTLANRSGVRNEFFEAEIDPETGGLRALRDPRDRSNRLGQQLVWQPGGAMKAEEIQVTANGPALGEVTATGYIADEHDQRLARFTQRYRAWAGRPMLELRVEIVPEKPPAGYAWHAYYAARFAGRDERAALLRGSFGHPAVTTHHRPGSPDFIELRSGKSNVLILTGGLPFAQRHGARMIDVILVTAGETATAFELALGIDRPQPAQSAQGFISPIAIVPLEHGPPPVGPTGWLAHLDANNVLLSSLRVDGSSPAVTARLWEVNGVGGPVSLRWARDPIAAAQVDGEGMTTMDAIVEGDAVTFDIMAHDLINVRSEWPA